MDNVEIPKWLKGLPLAPEFRPTDTEFADPIAYISKIEKEASAFGICKVIPPLPKPSKKYVFGNLNKSLSKCPELGSDAKFYGLSTPKVGSVDGTDDGEVRAVFTTRHQELGQSVKRTKGTGQCPISVVHKQVWQSGEIYTLDQFESKSRIFARSLLGALKEVSPLVTEALFWKAASEKPIYIEYANDVPGSAFGEPEGHSHHFCRRRRKRNFYRRSRESSNTKKDEIVCDNMKNMHNVDVKDTSDGGLITHSGTSKLSSTPANLYSDETSQSSKKMSHSSFCDMEGSAGWKLSNSPWNLQVIARSPGSLTRFMPDDIPGVTSPMVYVGMLFSWFAWHVEDHELHSMNFLHTGSSKTWYAVPGDYAFEFEEIVRSKAYGGNMDRLGKNLSADSILTNLDSVRGCRRLAALTLLGEKTTLVSPDVVVASGIPCCRLIQNPGEFVVTFPRAYHVGFSHGFNCGEAANFATPQWLKVAKEAAVRRAAMNYLPMLSHQQLLYLLTMSFVSRIPRSLLPGVRSSRLRDRQKEEREFLVKKAFIEDILIENNTLSVLVGKDTSYHAVFWNADSLLCPNKEPLSPSAAANVAAVPTENVSLIHPDPCNNDINYGNDNNLLSDDIELYMENLTDLYMDSDDLSCDFQIHSGTLACVACGILGYPFMSVVQPSEKASLNLLSDNNCLADESQGASTLRKPSGCDFMAENVPPVSSSQPAMDFPVPSATKFDNGWNTSDSFLRPRSFCLTHAVEIVELLRHKGGAKVLVICHSDYQRIKAHAAFIAEEVDSLFNYNEIPMDFASKEDLNLIDLAIDDEEKDGLGKDWTSKLGINLRHCIRIRKNSPSKQVQHALTLSGLFSDRIHSDLFTVKWLSRKFRTKKNSHLTHCKPCESAKLKKDEVVGESKDRTVKNEKLIQYSRRSYRRKPSGSTEVVQTGSICRQPALPQLDAHNRQVSESNFCQTMKFAGKSADFVFSALNGRSETRQINMLEATGDSCFEAHIEDHLSVEINMDGIVELEGPVVQDKTKVNEVYCEGKPENPNVHATDESCHVVREKQIVGLFNMITGLPDAASKGLPILADEAVVTGEVTLQIITDLPEGSFEKPMKEGIEEHCMDDENCYPLALDNEVQQEIHCGNRNNDKDPVSYCPTLKNGCASSVKNECHEDSTESLAARVSGDTTYLNALLKQEIKTREGSNEEAMLRNVPSVSKPSFVSMEGSFEIPKEHCSRAELCHDQTSKEIVPSTVMNVEFNHPCASYSEASIRSSVENDLGSGVMTLDPANEDDELMTNVTIEQEPVAQVENKKKPVSVKDHKVSESPSDKDLSHDGSRTTEDLGDVSKVCSSVDESDRGNAECTVVYPMSDAGKGRKRKRELEQITENKISCNGFIKSPCEGLRPRSCKDATVRSEIDIREEIRQTSREKVKKPSNASVSAKAKNENLKKSYKCDLEGCRMSFVTKAELVLHKRNLCPYEGCGKRFSSHKYARIHNRVHDDDRPLKCPWKGCSMTFKWAWARTEHIRVHTGERPYQCKVESCGLCFRFVSDFSRHRRKTGHYVN